MDFKLIAKHGWSISLYPVASQWGFEDIHFRGNFQENFIHHKSAYHYGGFQVVKMQGASNSWMHKN